MKFNNKEFFVIFSESFPFYNIHITVGIKMKGKDNYSMLVVHKVFVLGFNCEYKHATLYVYPCYVKK